MRNIIFFILLFPFNSIAQDALLEAMFKDWSVSKVEPDPDYSDYPETPDSSEPEFYSWDLGTPDNIPETIIIYESKPCGW
jgi:hypothetical protein